MDNELFEKYNSGYNEGFFFAAQVVASAVLRLIDQHPMWMLKQEREQAKASIKLKTKAILKKRGLIPYSYDVIMGKAEDVPINFNLEY